MEIPGKNNDIHLTNRDWQIGTLRESHMVASDVKSMTFSIPIWIPFQSGQHYDLRVTASDGYTAERSYSIASAPEQKGELEFGVQLLPDGEVSPYLFRLKEGRQIELRGPIGGHFIWNTEMPGPLILIGGGSGMVPLMSMIRHRNNHLDKDKGREVVAIFSARSIDHVLYKDELDKLSSRGVYRQVVTLTDSQPSNWTGYARRIDKEMIEKELGEFKDKMPMIFICGPTPFVEAISNELVSVGFNPHMVKTERFGG
ncbi:oxidoreductase [Candidatus Parcubacteria bacterium]|nr:oxidoreductase [Candidatus Parcubacteria bacterium]